MSGIYNFQPCHLLDFELDYELKIRLVTSTRTVADKRRILSRILKKEETKPGSEINLIITELTFNEEKEGIKSSLESIAKVVEEFEGLQTDSSFKRVRSRLNHVLGRAQRIPLPVDATEKTLVLKYIQEVNATCYKLEADLYDKLQPGQEPDPVTPTTPVINVAAPVVHCATRNVPISEWGVKFNGDGKTLYSFLEKLQELAQSRSVPSADLFQSAAEFFSGDAFVWYRSIKSSVTDWDSLIARLKRDFLHDDIEDDLWDQIKRRKQRKQESIVVFIAHLETLFSRLSRPPPEISKVKHIRQNLLPEFINRLALSDIRTVSELSNLCRKLEESNYMRDKNFSRMNSSTSQVNEINSKPVNNGGQGNNNNSTNRSSFSRSSLNSNSAGVSLPSTSFDNSLDSGPRTKQAVCWNCNMSNHTYQSCKAPRKIFCYKCGEPHFKVKTCPKCSKN